MKNINKIFIAASLLTAFQTQFAFSQAELASSNQVKINEEENQTKSFKVNIDGASLLLNGFGLGFGYSFFDKVHTSVFYSQQRLTESEDFRNSLSYFGSYNSTHDIRNTGLRVDVYPFTNFDRGGFYASASYVHVELRTTVDPINSNDVRHLRDYKNGLQFFAGYDFKRGFLKKLSSALNVGLGYGAGGRYSNNLGGTKNNIEDSLNIDAAYSFLF